jgi:plasmid stabilization system protein ParE
VLRVIAFGAFFLFAIGWYEYDRRTPPRRQRFDDALADHARGALNESRRIAASAREMIRPPVETKTSTNRTRRKKRNP